MNENHHLPEDQAKESLKELERLKLKLFAILDSNDENEKSEKELKTTIFALNSQKTQNEQLIEQLLSSGNESPVLMDLFTSLDFINELNSNYNDYCKGILPKETMSNNLSQWRSGETPGGGGDFKEENPVGENPGKNYDFQMHEYSENIELTVESLDERVNELTNLFSEKRYEDATKMVNLIVQSSATTSLKGKFFEETLTKEINWGSECAVSFQKSNLSKYLEGNINFPELTGSMVNLALLFPFQINEKSLIEEEESLYMATTEMEMKVNKFSEFFNILLEHVKAEGDNIYDRIPFIEDSRVNLVSLQLLQSCENWCESYVQTANKLFVKHLRSQNIEKSIAFLEQTYWNHEIVKILFSNYSGYSKAINFQIDHAFLSELILLQAKFSNFNFYKETFENFETERKIMKLVNELKKKFDVKLKMPQINLESSISLKNEIDIQAFYFLTSENLENKKLLSHILQTFHLKITKGEKIEISLTNKLSNIAENSLNSIAEFVIQNKIPEDQKEQYKSLLDSVFGLNVSSTILEKINTALDSLSQNAVISIPSNDKIEQKEKPKPLNLHFEGESRENTIEKKRNSPLFSQKDSSFNSFLNDQSGKKIDESNSSNPNNKSFRSIFETPETDKIPNKKFSAQRPKLGNKNTAYTGPKISSEKTSLLKQENLILKSKLESSLADLESEKRLNTYLKSLMEKDFSLYFY